METWNYQNPANNPTLQNDWNQTLISKLNELNKSVLNENNIISVGYVLKGLFESLMWLNKPIINYRYDNEHSIYLNGIKLRIENYEYYHQENEEWLESQKNFFLNLDSNPNPELYPNIWKNRESIRNHLNGKFSSNRIICDNDVIFVGIIINHTTNVGSVIYFHIDELKSKDAIYKYALTNNENKSLLPELSHLNRNDERINS